jgi:hypothetical protein
MYDHAMRTQRVGLYKIERIKQDIIQCHAADRMLIQRIARTSARPTFDPTFQNIRNDPDDFRSSTRPGTREHAHKRFPNPLRVLDLDRKPRPGFDQETGIKFSRNRSHPRNKISTSEALSHKTEDRV